MDGTGDARAIVVEGSFNLRDLGGLPVPDGRVVRRGRIFRSDYPGFATVAPEVVHDLGLRTVLDLRRPAEVEYECVAWGDLGVDHVVSPLSAGSKSSWHATYAAYLTHRPDRVVTAVRTVIDGAGQPVLFHCAAGMDRTGVVAALALALLGVADEQIIADYVLTDGAVPDILARLRTAGPYAALLADSSDEDQRPSAEAMAAFLDWLRAQGGAEQWLVAHGLPADEIAAYRTEMVEPAR